MPISSEDLLALKLRYNVPPMPDKRSLARERKAFLRTLTMKFMVEQKMVEYSGTNEKGIKYYKWNMDAFQDADYIYECIYEYEQQHGTDAYRRPAIS